jgi:hypothetical protein
MSVDADLSILHVLILQASICQRIAVAAFANELRGHPGRPPVDYQFSLVIAGRVRVNDKADFGILSIRRYAFSCLKSSCGGREYHRTGCDLRDVLRHGTPSDDCDKRYRCYDVSTSNDKHWPTGSGKG